MASSAAKPLVLSLAPDGLQLCCQVTPQPSGAQTKTTHPLTHTLCPSHYKEIEEAQSDLQPFAPPPQHVEII